VLADTGRFDVRVCEVPSAVSGRTLSAFDVLVDDCGGSAPGSDTSQAIAEFVDSGKGLVITRGALSSARSFRTAHGGGPAVSSEEFQRASGLWQVSPFEAVPRPAQFLEVRIAKVDHPIVHGLRSDSKIADAAYPGMIVSRSATVIARAKAENEPEEAALAVSTHGQGRVFVSALGDDLAAMQEPEFITTFVRGTEWAATGHVTLPADLGPPRPSPDAVRGLVITGGHDHETMFYTIFDGYKDLAFLPVASSGTAFQSDLRGKYDVVIMYDFSRDLDDKGKKNLRDFVESGKGIVVLHHALLDYQMWPWWYEEVVGGRYRLKSEGGVPSSTVKDRQQILVSPAQAHPITAGIGLFHIVDETYKRMGFSSRIRPLLTTDNPNSDRWLAWIGPTDQFKVVAIQLGHGHTAFGHPKYRALVHNAILWSAGRLQ
jgi:type 1 glutamine amidotransferase